MLYTFLDWGYIDTLHPTYHRDGGTVLGIKRRIEKLLNKSLSHFFLYWPPPYVHDPPTEFDVRAQRRFDKLVHHIGQEAEIKYCPGGKVIEIECKNYRCRWRYHKQKEVDVCIARDILSAYYENLGDPTNGLTDIVLLSGDQDLAPVLDLLSSRNVQISVPEGKNVARRLCDHSSTILTIDSILYPAKR